MQSPESSEVYSGPPDGDWPGGAAPAGRAHWLEMSCWLAHPATGVPWGSHHFRLRLVLLPIPKLYRQQHCLHCSEEVVK